MMNYYYAPYNENLECFVEVKRATSLNNARKNLMSVQMRNGWDMGAVASDPAFFKNFRSSEKYLVGMVDFVFRPDCPDYFYWVPKGKSYRDRKPIRKDGSIDSTR